MSSKLKSRLVAFFYEPVETGVHSRKWHAHAYYDHATRRRIMVAWPLHYALRAYRWLEMHWDNYRHRPGWIDRHAARAIERHQNRPRFPRY